MVASNCPRNGRRVEKFVEENGGYVDFCVSVSPNKMTHFQAIKFCESQGGFLPGKY